MVDVIPMDIRPILRNTKVLAAIILVLILAVAVATAPPADDDDKNGGGNGSETSDKQEHETVTFEFDGVAAGLVGFGFNGEHDFEVEEGAIKVIVNLSGEDTVGFEDLDLELDGASGGHATSGQPSTNEQIIINEISIIRRFGYGTYTTTVTAYVAPGTSYHVDVEVWYPINGTT